MLATLNHDALRSCDRAAQQVWRLMCQQQTVVRVCIKSTSLASKARPPAAIVGYCGSSSLLRANRIRKAGCGVLVAHTVHVREGLNKPGLEEACAAIGVTG